MSKHVNRYLYGYALWVDYGDGWEYEVWEPTCEEAHNRRREYTQNCPEYATKISKRREPNPEYPKTVEEKLDVAHS